jgi:predicted DNA-binding transcriptional regulator AlpA
MQTVDDKLNLIVRMLLSQKKVFTVDDLCLITGYSKSFIYKASANRILPHSSPSGGRIFFDSEAINEWLLSNPVPTRDQLKAKAINYVTLNPNGNGGKFNA